MEKRSLTAATRRPKQDTGDDRRGPAGNRAQHARAAARRTSVRRAAVFDAAFDAAFDAELDAELDAESDLETAGPLPAARRTRHTRGPALTHALIAMASKLLETESAVVLTPPGAHRASVIWLHGLGADGHDFVPIIGELGLAADHGIKFVFPHAPVRPIAINNNMPMRGWYDIPSLTRLDKQDEAGIRASEAIVHGLIKAEVDAGIPPARIVLAGFSQGGAITLYAGLRYPQRLAGLLPLSTYLPLHDRLAAERSAANQDVPILMCHGTYDPVLALALGTGSRDLLLGLGYKVEWREYPMQHQVCLEEIQAISAWLQQVLA